MKEMKKQDIISLLLSAGIGAFFIFILLVYPDFSRLLELKAYDVKMRLTASLQWVDKAIAQQIKIIHVADSTVREMGWPKQQDHARIIDILSQHQVSLIAYDWIFYEPAQELLTSSKKSKRLIWPVLFDLKHHTGFPKGRYSQAIFNQLEKYIVGQTPPASELWHTGNATLSQPTLFQSSLSAGHISSRNEEGSPLNDGTFRKVALVVDFSGQLFPSFSLVTACHYLHVPLEKIRVVPGKEIVLPGAVFPRTGIIKDIHIPINDRGEMWIYFPGQWEDNAFEPFWFESLLNKHEDKSWWPEFDERFSRSICFVGNSSSKSKDTHTTPMEDNYPGVGIHASALFTILSGNFINFTGTAGNIFIIIVTAFTVAYISIRYPVFKAAGIHLLLLAGYVVLTFLVFAKQRLVLPAIFPGLTILLGAVANLSYQLFNEQREKKSLADEYTTNKLLLSQTMNEVTALRDELKNSRQITREKLKKIADREKTYQSVFQRVKDLEKQLDKAPSLPQEQDLRQEEWELLSQEAGKAGIVTRNHGMLDIFTMVKQVAESKATVLILGETGTGKGNLAQAIRSYSSWKEKPFVTVDCGAMPENLLESELFGHEKGAFTNALRQKKGKFELADGGTIFLDEIGNTSPLMQMKLLRVLQEKEFERVGGEQAVKVDVRVIAATNTDLEEKMRTGNFREDLYYRLNVIGIDMPPLRERKEDIELLADYFIKKYVRLHDRSHVKGLSQKALKKLHEYDWPGNVRELENKIERAVLLTNHDLISEQDIVFNDADKVQTTHSSLAAREIRDNPDVDGDDDFLCLLNRNNFEIVRTAEELGLKSYDSVTQRFKGIILKAMADCNWSIPEAAAIIALDSDKVGTAESKIRKYYGNILRELDNYDSLEQLQEQMERKYKNIPKKFHRYILRMYEEKTNLCQEGARE